MKTLHAQEKNKLTESTQLADMYGSSGSHRKRNPAPWPSEQLLRPLPCLIVSSLRSRKLPWRQTVQPHEIEVAEKKTVAHNGTLRCHLSKGTSPASLCNTTTAPSSSSGSPSSSEPVGVGVSSDTPRSSRQTSVMGKAQAGITIGSKA